MFDENLGSNKDRRKDDLAVATMVNKKNLAFLSPNIERRFHHVPHGVVRARSDNQIRREARRVDGGRGQVASDGGSVNNGRAARERQRLRAHLLRGYDDGAGRLQTTRPVRGGRAGRGGVRQRHASTRVLDYRRVGVNDVTELVCK